jgi:hypothetical protein
LTIERLTKYFVLTHQHLLHFRFELAGNYPVFVKNSPNTLATLTANFCRDALVITRRDLGIQSIQVASFTTQQRAAQFAQFMTQKVGSGEVGTPTRIFK